MATQGQREQAGFLAGELTTTFLGEAGVESVGGSGSGAAGFPTITGPCCRISARVCPTPRGGCYPTRICVSTSPWNCW